jgi:acyl-CoA synthetase (AMP-forming)/AMP-acid ligase II
VLHLIKSGHATTFAGAPTMLLAQLDHPDFPGRDLSSVRSAFAGGATMPPALAARIESTVGVPLSIQYGQTEASPCITQTRPGDSPADRAETLGRPHPQVEVQITDPATGETLSAGAVGEILTRGYHVMKGYFGNPAATTEAVDTAGWLHTGDLGSMDERGYCRIESRLKEMIIRGGENIYPREIEQLLNAHPAVADVAVVGVPDGYWGEQVAAFVRPGPGNPVTQDELASYSLPPTSPPTRHRGTGSSWTPSRSPPPARSRNSSSESSSPQAQPPRRTSHTAGPSGHSPQHPGRGDGPG